MTDYIVLSGVIYFWNLHIHIFRKNYHKIALTEVFDFLKMAYDLLNTFAISKSIVDGSSPSVDDKLLLCITEALAIFYEQTDQLPLALETVNKGLSQSTSSAYLRKKLSELVSRYSATSAAAPAAKGSKPAADTLKTDNPFLTALGLLSQIEAEATPDDQRLLLTTKVIETMNLDGANLLKTLDWQNMSQDDYDQILELQAECWTRLTRAKIKQNDTLGAQEMAENCMQLIAGKL